MGFNYDPRSALNKTTPGSRRGVISFVAIESMINDGTVFCKGKGAENEICGGTINMVQTECVNNGQISCDPHGTFRIWCSKFVNEGVITTTPTVHIMDIQTLKHYAEILCAMTEAVPFALEVAAHRGHWNEYHPRNLLAPGTDTYYWSDRGIGAIHEDWIVFRVKTDLPFVMSRIEIRNNWNNSGVKRISIEGSVDGITFEEWIEIDNIEQNKNRLQSFDVDIASIHHALDTKWRFYRFGVLENYGFTWTSFYEFAMLGVVV